MVWVLDELVDSLGGEAINANGLGAMGLSRLRAPPAISEEDVLVLVVDDDDNADEPVNGGVGGLCLTMYSDTGGFGRIL